jgi:hypothetical protein
VRSFEEIVAKVQETRGEIFSFHAEVLVPFLPFDIAKQFLVADAKAENWKPTPFDRETVLGEMRTYMAEYGWPKATEHRGLSASRTVDKMRAWSWLLGDDKAVELCDGDYAPYGAPILKALSDYFGFPVPDSDGAKRMAAGEACDPECESCMA